MTVDDGVRAALSDLAAAVTPLADPVGRVYARMRRSRRRRRTTIGVVVVFVLALAVPLAVQAQPSGRWDTVAQWAERMTDVPRGPLAGDHGFIASLEQRVMERERHATFGISAAREYQAARVVFAGDVAGTRIALVALQVHDPRDGRFPDDALWLSAPAGSSPSVLTGEAGVQVFRQGLEPLEAGHFADGLTVAVVPSGCAFEAAAVTSIDSWVPEPTGDYLVRASWEQRAEWWRVTCDGIIRVERPSMAPRNFDSDAAAVAAVSTHARGDRSQLTGQRYGQAALAFGHEVYDPPKVVWSGLAPGAVPWTRAATGYSASDESSGGGYGIVLASPLLGDGWKLSLSVVFDQAGGGSVALQGEYGLSEDPTDARSLLPMRLNGQVPSVVVVAPAGAAKVRAVNSETTVAESAVTDGSAVLRVPSTVNAGYEALNASGQVIARSELLATGVRTARPWREDWGFPLPAPTD